jgi:DNA-directed RNA polymerase specialized sigma24 family protein
VEQAWNDIWEQEQLRRAVEEVRQEMGTTKTFRAFEMYVILDLPPQEVSQRLELHVDNVYRAKEAVTRKLREKLNAIRATE